MPVLSKGNFSINLGFVSIGGELEETDRQCAWELYCELISRVALVGKLDAAGHDVFAGERYDQSLDSLYIFVDQARGLMRRYPVGRIGPRGPQNHLGLFIASLLETVIRPFLEKWQASYRHWWGCAQAKDPERSPFLVQAAYPLRKELEEDWGQVRTFCRAAARELTERFSLPDVAAVVPPRLAQAWVEEIDSVVERSRHV